MLDILIFLTSTFSETPVADCPHAELLQEAARHVPFGAAVLDAGCGLGLFLDHLPADVKPYLGLDVHDAMIDACRRRYGGRAGAAFEKADLATADLGVGRYDVVAFLNTLGEPGRFRQQLRVGGFLHRCLLGMLGREPRVVVHEAAME